ncbi:DEAD/DEAH box helicase [Roseococcus sp. SYP-B2431]|uniref:DEAD/DEAH box helicase n=1 Tax=Roseococcus sp. SYP-B2431 TaxID=2496640 RepID=UPI00103CE856|nr:DEAD/DEAH box helicase [Roseococcus sp. SYP-B2431]TCH98120.1 DEAD/DEAH box helicase [Roseococcus sp. SYP-B2431]
MEESEGGLAAALVEQSAQGGGIIFLARSETRAARLARAAQALAPGLAVHLLPGWDCLPYDTTSPSRQAMGQRMAAMGACARRDGSPVLLVAGVNAATQRLPPECAHRELTMRLGEEIDPEALEEELRRLGYALEDRVDEPGEAALRGSVLDAYPAGGTGLPCRIEHAEGRVLAIRLYDPLTQRSTEEVQAVTLGPASELVLAPDAEAAHEQGIEHALAAFYPRLSTVFDLLPEAAIVADAEVQALADQRAEEVRDAFRLRAPALPEDQPALLPSEPDALYLIGKAWREALAKRHLTTVQPSQAEEPAVPRFLSLRDPEEAFLDFLEAELSAGRSVALSGSGHRTTLALQRLVRRRLELEPLAFESWSALRAAPPGSFGVLDGLVGASFAAGGAAVIAPGEVRQAGGRRDAARRRELLALGEGTLQPGDAIIHLDHGLGALRGLETVEVGEARMDCLKLEYAGGKAQLVPLDETDRLWRYGAEAEGVTLDRLGGDGWEKRRTEVEAQIRETASALARLAEGRAELQAPAIRPRGRAYESFAARFPHSLTEDQSEAIEAVLSDLASGRPMDRLVCGDVGFGKTEVALHAVAAAVFAGWQVAVLAPTTVLVRQHLNTFRRRFAGLETKDGPIRIEQLSRLSSAAEAKAVKAGLADGGVRIAIGTQALLGRAIRFRELGLVVIDEEQRFGARQKASLRQLAARGHVLSMTATPIPRTLQAALLGLEDVSVIATPPGRRQPIRTAHVPLDDVLLRQALEREKRRGGQSFVVCSRIEDLPAMRERIRDLLPRLKVIEAHGELPPAEVDDALVRFAEGKGDVLLSTNIVETGLDVPRANTMLVWRADRFGLGQLHQLRGRVGRGRVRGSIFLLTDPAQPPTPLTLKRLKTLEAFDRVGAGFAISARDMDLRGAGDLLGESQAGHMKLIGLDLYQHLLDRAFRAARGEAVTEDWTPSLAIEVSAGIPEEVVEGDGLRIELHARLAGMIRRGDLPALEDFEEEMRDRFGPPAGPLGNLLTLARLRMECRRLGIVRMDVGPAAAAATFRSDPPTVSPPLELRGGRVVLPRPSGSEADRIAAAVELLQGLAGSPRKLRRRASLPS